MEISSLLTNWGHIVIIWLMVGHLGYFIIRFGYKYKIPIAVYIIFNLTAPLVTIPILIYIGMWIKDIIKPEPRVANPETIT